MSKEDNINANYYFKICSKRNFINQLIKNHPGSIIILSDKGIIKYVNGNFLNLTGYSYDELIEKNYFEIFTLDTEDVEGYFKNIITKKAENPYSHINNIITKDGKKVLMMFTNFTIEDKNKIVGVISFGYDITFREEYINDVRLINNVVINLTHDYNQNIKNIISLAKDISKADAVVYNIYNRLSNEFLKIESVDFDEFPECFKAEGTLCYELLKSSDRDIVFENISDTNSNFRKKGLNIYYGVKVDLGNEMGTLCFFYKSKDVYIKRERISFIVRILERVEIGRKYLESIKSEKEKFFKVLENISVGVVYASKKTREIFYVNRKLLDICSITKITPHEKLTLDFFKEMIVDKKALEDFVKEPEKYLGSIELEAIRVDGKKRFIKLTLSDINEPDNLLILVNDITDEVIQRKKAVEFTSKLNVYSLIDMIFIKNPPPSLYQNIVDFMKEYSKAEYAFLGFVDREKDEFKFYAMTEGIKNGCKIGDIFEYKKFVDKNSLWAQTLEHGKVFFINEERFIEGHIPIKNAASIPLKYGDETIGVIMIVNRNGGWDNNIVLWLEDISSYISQRIFYVINNEKLMQEVISTKSREFALNSTSSLAAGIAHDLNNMLVPVLTNISLIKEKIGDNEIKEMLDEAGKYLLSAVNLIKSFSNLSNPSMVECNEVSMLDIKNTLQMILSGLLVKGEVRIIPKLKDVYIITDRIKLFQILTNLCTNAAYAAKECGNTKVEVDILLPEDENYIAFNVTDYGLGIDEKIIGNIFKPYFTTKKEGKGLGLFISYNIAKVIGGELTFVSEPNKFTTFTLKIPYIKSKHQNEYRDNLLLNKELKVLIVDDEEFIIKSLNKMLRYLGCVSYGVKNSTDALKFLSENEVDIVIIDLILENGERGKELNLEIKKTKPSIFSVVSSGYTDDDVIMNYNSYGFDYYLPKPYSLDTLKKLISFYLQLNKK